MEQTEIIDQSVCQITDMVKLEKKELVFYESGIEVDYGTEFCIIGSGLTYYIHAFEYADLLNDYKNGKISNDIDIYGLIIDYYL